MASAQYYASQRYPSRGRVYVTDRHLHACSKLKQVMGSSYALPSLHTVFGSRILQVFLFIATASLSTAFVLHAACSCHLSRTVENLSDVHCSLKCSHFELMELFVFEVS